MTSGRGGSQGIDWERFYIQRVAGGSLGGAGGRGRVRQADRPGGVHARHSDAEWAGSGLDRRGGDFCNSLISNGLEISNRLWHATCTVGKTVVTPLRWRR
jgi:hypothetical protein